MMDDESRGTSRWASSADSRVAHPDQVVGTRLVRVVGGPGDGALVLSMWSPAGTEVDLQVDRGLDILSVRDQGVRYGWAGPSGLAAGNHYDPHGFGWQRTFYGGLLTTCGLEHVGDPLEGVPNEQLPPRPRPVSYGEHGRIGHSEAELVARTIDYDQGVVRVRGIVRQGAIYDERFELDRTVELRLDRAELRLRDVVRNVGSLPARHSILYHLNFGHPVAGPGAIATDGHNSYTTPELAPDAAEIVTRWESPGGSDRWSEIRRPDESTAVRCTQSATLPHLFLWSVPRARTNALGLAPSSTPLDGSVERIGADETRTYEIRLEFGEVAPRPVSGRN